MSFPGLACTFHSLLTSCHALHPALLFDLSSAPLCPLVPRAPVVSCTLLCPCPAHHPILGCVIRFALLFFPPKPVALRFLTPLSPAGIIKILFKRIAFQIRNPSAKMDCIPTCNHFFTRDCKSNPQFFLQSSLLCALVDPVRVRGQWVAPNPQSEA